MEVTEVKLTRWQRANLAKLAAYLRTLPKDYPDFEMSSFSRDGEGGSFSRAHVPPCGTAACAAGHGPRAGIRPRYGEDWQDYSTRAFLPSGSAWSWGFNGDWSKYDNTVHGAAARIEYLLENGLPEKWEGDPAPRFKKIYGGNIDPVRA